MELIEVLNNDENNIILSLVKRGIVPYSLLNHKAYYEYYRSKITEYKKGNGRYKMRAVEATEEEFRICTKTVYNCIKLMES